jgi:serine/threonine-protein kinase RsbW
LRVEASTACADKDVVTPGSFSWHVLTSLADDVQTYQNGDGVFGVALTTRRAGSHT